VHRREPVERFDPGRKAFRDFLKRHKTEGALLIGVGRADFLKPGGPLRLIRDHVNITGNNPLMGRSYEGDGPRFPSQHAVWRTHGISGIETCVAAAAEPLQFVTNAEREFLRKSDLDAVSGEVICEAILANFFSIPTIGVLVDRRLEDAEKEISHSIGNILKTVN